MLSQEPKKARLWGGRFRTDTDPVMEKFNNSINFDRRMWAQDINGSQAYAKALAVAGILTTEEAQSIHDGLEKVREEWAAGSFAIEAGDEDIHTANERRLTELIGEAGKKLHTGRSRNDQVVTDLRLWLRDQAAVATADMTVLIQVCCDMAEKHMGVLMAGYTHLQPAQPVRFSHWLMSHVAALQRDMSRLQDMLPRLNTLPLGCGALAGHAFGIDRDLLKRELGFGDVSLNSMDTVCDRDFVAEYMWWSSLTLTHLSQLAEDLIIMNYIRGVALSDAYSTGSSLMPQKKNPDALELLRGKAGRVTGHLCGFLTTLKGLPRTYNKDLQEDKEPLFDTVDTVHDCLRIAAGVVATLTPLPEGLGKALVPEMLATDLAEYLVRKGVPFRETHHISGAAVKMAEDRGFPLSALTPEDLRTLHPSFADDVAALWNYETSVERKNAAGGTAQSSVEAQIARVRGYLVEVGGGAAP
ncbi:argininosuccinate lyase [Tribonema minus]|uniref:Argininosuccinate lyase n=1 Tax=Tribonema minus TaxID=303371 RepID=A0A835Z435_9STRA|nr:argininosuccinate lyase [Tribonema minus]